MTTDYVHPITNTGTAISTTEDFHRAWRLLEADARVDDEGGGEWRGQLAFWLAHELGVEPTNYNIHFIVEALSYVQFHDQGDLDKTLGFKDA